MLASGATAAPPDQPTGLNILLLTADDMHYDSLGVTGCPIPGISPHLDRLATEGMLFTQAHVTIAVCQPCRSVLMTGRYPHRNAARGFEPINRNVPTLGEQLRDAGYLNGILGKTTHLAPAEKYCWDQVTTVQQLGAGRDPARYGQYATTFFREAKRSGRPFFLMANAHDPHRPFAGSLQEQNRRKRQGDYPDPARVFQADEVPLPGFLPDLPAVRREIAEYYGSVHRADAALGAVLTALAKSGLAEKTLVVFLSDHGMALPFAKTNCYRASTHTPWIVRWPGKVQRGAVDETHMISGIDLMPTLLEAAGLKPVPGVDGRSILPLLEGQKQEDRDHVLTVFHKTSGRREYPMRSVQNARFGYIYNAWSDGKTVFRNESQNGRTFKAMRQAAKEDPRIAQRVQMFQYRVPEELYDYENDPDALVNLIDDPRYVPQREALRQLMRQRMQSIEDPLLERFTADLESKRDG
jgi:N-sulfoglucosamine sulfohydrolase